MGMSSTEGARGSVDAKPLDQPDLAKAGLAQGAAFSPVRLDPGSSTANRVRQATQAAVEASIDM